MYVYINGHYDNVISCSHLSRLAYLNVDFGTLANNALKRNHRQSKLVYNNPPHEEFII